MKINTQKQIVLAKWVKYFEKVITPIIIVFLDFHLWNGIATINYVKWRNHLTKQIKEENDKMIWYKLVFVFLYISSLQRWQNKFFSPKFRSKNQFIRILYRRWNSTLTFSLQIHVIADLWWASLIILHFCSQLFNYFSKCTRSLNRNYVNSNNGIILWMPRMEISKRCCILFYTLNQLHMMF